MSVLQDMAKLLQAVGTNGPLRLIIRRIATTDRGNNLLEYNPIEVRAKTGTLNFVSSLVGYIKMSEGSELVFTIFAANLERRELGKISGYELPEGASSWNRRAKLLQQKLLQRRGNYISMMF